MDEADIARWALLPSWTLEEAAALAAGLPPQQCSERAAKEAGLLIPPVVVSAEYEWNLKLLLRAAPQELPLHTRNAKRPGLSTVRPVLFLKWAHGRITVPEALTRSVERVLAQPLADYEPLMAELVEARQEAFDLRLRVGELETALAKAHLAVPTSGDHPIGTRERVTALRIVRALSVMAKLPDRGAAVAVEMQLQELGYDGPARATIRKWLDDARGEG